MRAAAGDLAGLLKVRVGPERQRRMSDDVGAVRLIGGAIRHGDEGTAGARKRCRARAASRFTEATAAAPGVREVLVGEPGFEPGTSRI